MMGLFAFRVSVFAQSVAHLMCGIWLFIDNHNEASVERLGLLSS